MSIRPLLLAAALLTAPLAGAAHADDARTPLHLPRNDVSVRVSGRIGHGRPVHVHRHDCCRWVAPRYEIRRQRVVVPGHYVESVAPAEFAVRWDACRRTYVRIEIRSRRVVRTWVPERVEIRRHRIRVPGRWICG